MNGNYLSCNWRKKWKLEEKLFYDFIGNSLSVGDGRFHYEVTRFYREKLLIINWTFLVIIMIMLMFEIRNYEELGYYKKYWIAILNVIFSLFLIIFFYITSTYM